MRTSRHTPVGTALLLFSLCLLAGACGNEAIAPAPTSQPTALEITPVDSNGLSPTGDKESDTEADALLEAVHERGVLRVATESNYPPQSQLNPDGTWEGFDIEVAREIAHRMGVNVEFRDMTFDVLVAGSWNDRWDVNVGSMTVTPKRTRVLLFTDPYYYTPATFVVHKDSTLTQIEELDGKAVGVGAETTYQDYLNNKLVLAGEDTIPPPPNATTQLYETDLLALQDLALGEGVRLDAVLTALPTAHYAIASGEPFKVLGEPIFYEELAVALDRHSSLPSDSLQKEMSRIIAEMRSDGTLTRLSKRFYGIDITTRPR